MEIKGVVKITYNKVNNSESIDASIYINDILDSQVIVDTARHPEGSIQDGLDTYNNRLIKLTEKYASKSN